ncbi:MAG TPA: glycine--tRNA ligase subunit beta [Kofleriaceae bacterium]|nr:glycine--tRNA ligase subunit beta [Kofleriaceae bacterium]
MPADLLFEIGCEEIPARMLARALAELPAQVDARLAAARLEHGATRALGTPRRLAVIVTGLADRQPDLNEEVVGPPASAAVDADHKLTKAGQGFAAKNGILAQFGTEAHLKTTSELGLQLREVPGKKGLYLVATRHVVGGETRALLPELLRELAAGIAWPKSMRWGWSETTFVRPVQWLVALYGGEVVPLSWAGQTAGRKTRGHRFLAPGWIDLAGPGHYVEALRAAHVVVDPEARRVTIEAELARIAKETGCRVREDATLLAEVMNLGEWPVGITGQFDPSYLEVPAEIIVTAMRTHQRYFAMEDAQGKLANRFATVMATTVTDPAVVQRGNQNVLAARLADAKFFFAEDRKHTFEQWNEKLDGIVFQAKLGEGAKTIGNKVRRIETIVRDLGGGAAALRAAHLCKADLASTAVGEFPELQGVMGRHYARLAGENDAVANAIEQHWWPKGQGAALPQTGEAALVAIADRMDTLVGCFAVGLEPTGSADPLGLRRAAIGIWSIVIDRGWKDVYTKAFDASVAALALEGVKLADRKPIDEFFRARLRGIFVDSGIAAQDTDAALAQGYADPVDARARALACGKIPKEAREVFKRIANILDDARVAKHEFGITVDASLFQPVEARLWTAFAREQGRAFGDYNEQIGMLVALQPDVAAFFDKGGVMVMDPDPKLRSNRLSLLNAIYSRFSRIADFRKLGASA